MILFTQPDPREDQWLASAPEFSEDILILIERAVIGVLRGRPPGRIKSLRVLLLLPESALGDVHAFVLNLHPQAMYPFRFFYGGIDFSIQSCQTLAA